MDSVLLVISVSPPPHTRWMDECCSTIRWTIPKSAIICKYFTWTYYHPAHVPSLLLKEKKNRPALFRDFSTPKLWNPCCSLYKIPWTSHFQLKYELPAEVAACKKAEKAEAFWVFKLLQTWNQWSPTFQEVQLTPKLKSESTNPTSTSDNQWTWLAGSAQLGLNWKWNLSEGTELS